jgi:radical S-adenosyl methionine domain-containing protein 2
VSNSFKIPETVNIHLWPRCNQRCRYCYGQFPERPSTLGFEGWADIARSLATAGVRRLNFSGGEPTLHPDMLGIARATRAVGLMTSIVTNGARLTSELLAEMNVVALSIDAGDDAGNERIGRVGPSGRSYVAHIEDAAARVRAAGGGLKLNTVVTRLNLDADLTALCRRVRPDKFKLLQFVSVEGENAERAPELAVSSEEFKRFVERHQPLENDGIWVQPESADTIAASYVMLDPSGRIFQHHDGTHIRSLPLTETSFESALQSVGGYDREVFEARGGALSVRRLPLLPRGEV